MKHSKLWVYLGIILLTLIWGNAFVAIKVALRSISPVQLLVFRYVPASLIFLVILYRSGGLKLLGRMRRVEIIQLALVALFGIPAYNFALNWGEQHITAGMAALIIALSPGITFILSLILLGEKTSLARKILGLVIAFLGLVFLVYSAQLKFLSDQAGGTIWLGALVTLVSPLSWAFYTILGKPLVARYRSVDITAWATILGTIPIVFLIRPSTFAGIGDFPLSFWIAILWLILFCTIVGFVVWYWALKRSNPTEISAFIYLIPAWSIIFGRIILDEPITLSLFVGGALILFGVSLVNTPTRPSKTGPIVSEASSEK